MRSIHFSNRRTAARFMRECGLLVVAAFLAGVSLGTPLCSPLHAAPGDSGPKDKTAPRGTGGDSTSPPDKRSLTEINRAWMRELRPGGTPAGKEKEKGHSERKTEGPRATEPQGESSKGPGAPGEPLAPEPTTEPLRLNNPPPSAPKATEKSRLFADQAEDTSFLSVVFRFVAILAVMLGGFYMFARYTRGRRGLSGTGGDLVQVVASVPLIQGKFLQVVDMAGRLLVLGVSDQSVTLLSEVSDARTADRIRVWQSQNRSVPEAARGALSRLTNLIRGTDFRFWNAAGEGASGAPERVSFRSVLRSEGGSAVADVARAGGPESQGNPAAALQKSQPRTARGRQPVQADDIDSDSGTGPGPGGDFPAEMLEPRDLFDFNIPAETAADGASRGDADVDEEELRELLRAQRKRLQRLKGSV